MTKRRFEREVDALRDEVLGDLSSGERLHAWLQQVAADEETQATQLDETAPREDHSMRDPEYVVEQIAVRQLRQTAVYRLHRCVLEFRWRHAYQVLEILIQDEERLPADSWAQPGLVLCRLNDLKNMYADLAEDEYDVELETFLAPHKMGQRVFNDVTTTLLRYEELRESARAEHVEPQTETDGEDPSDGDNASSS